MAGSNPLAFHWYLCFHALTTHPLLLAVVVPPQLLLYMAVAPEEKIKFNSAGPSGPERFEAGVAGYEARGFRGLGVFTSTPYGTRPNTLLYSSTLAP